MKKKLYLIIVILLSFLAFFTHILFSDAGRTCLISQINDYVKNEKFTEEGEYIVSDGEYRKNEKVKKYIITDNNITISYYAENTSEVYAKVSEDFDKHQLEITYYKEYLLVRLSGELFTYCSKMDYEMQPINREETSWYNHICTHISEDDIFELNDYFISYNNQVFK